VGFPKIPHQPRNKEEEQKDPFFDFLYFPWEFEQVSKYTNSSLLKGTRTRGTKNKEPKEIKIK
jgi:hypothetical protein